MKISTLIERLHKLADELPNGHQTEIGVWDSSYGETYRIVDVAPDDEHENLVYIDYAGPVYNKGCPGNVCDGSGEFLVQDGGHDLWKKCAWHGKLSGT